ncbi:MAG: flavin monoamine oxidase family protein [Anaerobacillus sp.]|uniref:flavin monoamine oxidase family protein n=1 Tax=Anaerobacillus sp. TaxID=1872506 RepID=UPI0039194968
MSICQEVDVVIIGAGLAGLSAALELKKQNISFTVLESKECVGGRVLSFKTEENVTIDMGAQWIDRHHHHIQELLSQFELEVVPTYKKGKSVFFIDGKRTVGKLPPLSIAGFVDVFQFTRKLNKLSSKIIADSPWNSLDAKEYDKLTMAQFLKENMYTVSGYHYYKYLLEEMLCTYLHEVSTLDVLWCVKTAGTVQNFRNAEALWLKEGVGVLVEKMAEQIAERIQFKSPVTVVTYDKNYAIVESAEKCWKAQRVIITIPPNLQREIQFKPPLPSLRAQLLEHCEMPSVTKIVLVYSKPFWRELGLSGMVKSDIGPINEAVDSSPRDGKRGVLTVLVTGESARGLKKPSEEVPLALVPFFGEQAANPLQIFVENWSEQPWTRGGYGVHFGPGVITNYEKVLLEPIACLHFAGTETATKWRLFMEGAVHSGEQAAIEVTKYL